MDSLSWVCLRDHPSKVVFHVSDLAVVSATDEDSINFDPSLLNQDGGCCLSTPLVDVALDDNALALLREVFH